MRACWPFIYDKCKDENTAISLSENGKIITGAKSVCNIFNDCYINIDNEVSKYCTHNRVHTK